MFALGKCSCFVAFDSTRQAVLDEKYEAARFHVEPSHRYKYWQRTWAIAPSQVVKSKVYCVFTVCENTPSVCGYVCVFACALAYQCLLQKLPWSARFSLGRAARQTPRSKQDNRWQYANGTDSLFPLQRAPRRHLRSPTSPSGPKLCGAAPPLPAPAWLISHQALHFFPPSGPSVMWPNDVSLLTVSVFWDCRRGDVLIKRREIKLFTFKRCRWMPNLSEAPSKRLIAPGSWTICRFFSWRCYVATSNPTVLLNKQPREAGGRIELQ